MNTKSGIDWINFIIGSVLLICEFFLIELVKMLIDSSCGGNDFKTFDCPSSIFYCLVGFAIGVLILMLSIANFNKAFKGSDLF